jgi:hypothetical protein
MPAQMGLHTTLLPVAHLDCLASPGTSGRDTIASDMPYCSMAKVFFDKFVEYLNSRVGR